MLIILGKFIQYTAFEQIKDITPILLLSILVGGMIYLNDVFVLKDQIDIVTDSYRRKLRFFNIPGAGIFFQIRILF